MDRIKLVLINESYEASIMDYKKEFEINNDSLDGTASLGNYDDFQSWYDRVKANIKEETVKEGCVPATTYLAVRKSDKRLIGMIDIRHRLNDYLFQYGGNIGYSIRKSERRKGYATEMLRLALEECKRMNMDKVLVTCDKSNEGSAKTIKKNGGILENEVLEDGELVQRYWITIK